MDAHVEIVVEPNVGKKIVQTGPCSAWDEGGFLFNDVPLGVTIRLRATKDGYRSKEVETMAITSGRALNITLQKK